MAGHSDDAEEHHSECFTDAVVVVWRGATVAWLVAAVHGSTLVRGCSPLGELIDKPLKTWALADNAAYIDCHRNHPGDVVAGQAPADPSHRILY